MSREGRPGQTRTTIFDGAYCCHDMTVFVSFLGFELALQPFAQRLCEELKQDKNIKEAE